MKSTKLTRTLFAGMMTCSMALTAVAVPVFTGPTVTQAATETEDSPNFTLNLHKKKVTDMTQTQNTGDKIPTLDALAGLNDIKFSAYNVTELFYQVKAEEKLTDNKKVADLLSRDWETKYRALAGSPIDTQTTATVDNADGIASFTLPKRTEALGNSMHSIFMFEELDLEGEGLKDIYLKSQPFLLGMNQTLADKNTVELYPKNYGATKDLVDDKDIPLEDGYYSYNVGDDVKYISTSPVPEGVNDPEFGYTSITFLDEMDKVGTSFKEITGISAGGVDVLEDFMKIGNPINSNEEGWTGKFAGFQFTLKFSADDLTAMTPDQQKAMQDLLDKIAGKQLKFEYKMTINEEATPYLEIGNKFYGKFTQHNKEQVTTDDAPPVETGGILIRKQDSEDKKVGLKGAHFVIKKDTAEGIRYAKLLDKDGEEIESTTGDYIPNEVEWKEKLEDATTIISGDQGHLLVHGLKAGSYKLEETQAPTGYKWTEKETTFTVDEAKVNIQDIGKHEVNNDPDDEMLPITGGIGIVTFLAIGAMAMGGAVYYKKKKA